MYKLVIIFCLAFKEAFVKLCDFMCAKYCRNKWDERNKRWQELHHHGLLLPASLAVHPRGQSQPTQGGQKRLSQLHGPLIIWARNIFHPMKVHENKSHPMCNLTYSRPPASWISLMALCVIETNWHGSGMVNRIGSLTQSFVTERRNWTLDLVTY